MSIPGSNLLKTAFRIIAQQTVQYYANTGRTSNQIKQYIPTFAEPVALKGNVQPVPRNKYVQFGLNLNRDYITFYVIKNVLDLERGVAGDRLTFNNRAFQAQSSNDWFAVDGWVGVICVDIGLASEVLTVKA